MWARSLGQKDPLEEGTATHSTILTWRISWTGGPRIPPVHRITESDTTEVTQHLVRTHTHVLSFVRVLTHRRLKGNQESIKIQYVNIFTQVEEERKLPACSI